MYDVWRGHHDKIAVSLLLLSVFGVHVVGAAGCAVLASLPFHPQILLSFIGEYVQGTRRVTSIHHFIWGRIWLTELTLVFIACI